MIAFLNEREALDALANGEVISVPTDTVYGVAASLESPLGIEKLFRLKRRPGELALPVLVHSLEQIELLGVELDARARRLARAFWPGALTVVLAAPGSIASKVGGSSSTVGFRIPNDEQLLSLLARSGPLCVTSANEHGAPPCQSAEQVRMIFSGRDELFGVLDAGPRQGAVSTVVDLASEPWRVARVGAISDVELSKVLD